MENLRRPSNHRVYDSVEQASRQATNRGRMLLGTIGLGAVAIFAYLWIDMGPGARETLLDKASQALTVKDPDAFSLNHLGSLLTLPESGNRLQLH